MLTLAAPQPRADGKMTRRALLRAGWLALGGLTLADYLRLQAAAARPAARDRAVILVWLGGGIPHIDMYDMKPDAPAEVRGEFKPISTPVAGMQICEHMPLQARLADKFTLLRTLSHTDNSHGMAIHHVMTGHRLPVLTPDALVGNNNPSCGSVVAKLRGPNRPNVPAYAVVPWLSYRLVSENAAYLGGGYNPFIPYKQRNDLDLYDPRQAQVEGLSMPSEMSVGRLGDRRALLETMDGIRKDLDRSGNVDRFYGDAFEMLSSETCRTAFDLARESPKLRDRYGRNQMGQSALLARRLVEAGVTFVTLNATYNKVPNGWDTHYNNFPSLKNDLLPRYDQFFSALIDDLHERGLDEKVLVVAVGEFGRSPKINNGGGFGGPGRDHWAASGSAVIVGGGFRMGQVIGRTDAIGAYPTSDPISPQDLLATIYRFLGIDPHHELRDHNGRPIPLVYGGKPIEALFV
jgi:Protein of unknown function (DUF1501)